MPKKKPFVPKEKTPIRELRDIAADLDCAIGIAQDYMDVCAKGGTTPMTRKELTALIKQALKDLAAWDKKYGTEDA